MRSEKVVVLMQVSRCVIEDSNGDIFETLLRESFEKACKQFHTRYSADVLSFEARWQVCLMTDDNRLEPLSPTMIVWDGLAIKEVSDCGYCIPRVISDDAILILRAHYILYFD